MLWFTKLKMGVQRTGTASGSPHLRPWGLLGYFLLVGAIPTPLDVKPRGMAPSVAHLRLALSISILCLRVQPLPQE